MKKTLALILLSTLGLSGCATIQRHPVATGIIAGAAIGITIGVLTRQHSCTYTYDGKPVGTGTTCPYHEPKESIRLGKR